MWGIRHDTRTNLRLVHCFFILHKDLWHLSSKLWEACFFLAFAFNLPCLLGTLVGCSAELKHLHIFIHQGPYSTSEPLFGVG